MVECRFAPLLEMLDRDDLSDQQIEDELFGWPLIHVTSTSGLIVKDNEYPKAHPEWQPVSSGGKSPEPIELEQCENVESSQ